MLTARKLLVDAIRLFHLTPIEAEAILSFILKKDKVLLYLQLDEEVEREEVKAFFSLCRRRAEGEPFAYIVGRKEFMSLDFLVTPAVFIPRPATEAVVEAALHHIQDGMCVLDLGTGTGCIIISVAKWSGKKLSLFASDISFFALCIAKKNAKMHGVKLHLLCTDLFCSMREESFDIILSNPPYIPCEKLSFLPIEIREYEPKIAINGGRKGLFYIEKILLYAPKYLKKGGHLFLEIPDRESVLPLLEKSSSYEGFSFMKDLSGNERVLHARKA